MQLSEHFSLYEFTRSDTAKAHGWKNEPGQAEIEWMIYLCVHVLEPLRAFLGRPVVISSGYRSPKLNDAVGGVSASQHMYGQAADIGIMNESEGKRIMSWLRQNKYVNKALFERSRKTGRRWIHIATAAVPIGYFNDNYPAK